MSVRHLPVDRSHAERGGLNGQRSIERLDRQNSRASRATLSAWYRRVTHGLGGSRGGVRCSPAGAIPA